MAVLRLSLTEELVRELSTWQLQFRSRSTENKHQGSLEKLELHGAGTRHSPHHLIGKLSWMKTNLGVSPDWNADRNQEMFGSRIPREEFRFRAHKLVQVILHEGSSCAIRNPDSDWSLIFFAPGNSNWLWPRQARLPRNHVRLPTPAKENKTKLSRRCMSLADWQLIEAASSSVEHRFAQAVRDLMRIKTLCVEGAVLLWEFFPEMQQLYNKPNPYLALPLKSRINDFFVAAKLPYRVKIKPVDREATNWKICIFPVLEESELEQAQVG